MWSLHAGQLRETERQLSLSVVRWGRMTWHRPPLALRPAEVTVRPEQARNSACWESERVHYITEYNGNTGGCHYHNLDTREKCQAYGGCNPFIWVGWEKCIGHKCLWRADERSSWYEIFLCWYQTNITPLHLLFNTWLFHQVLPNLPSKVCPMSLMSLYSCSRSMCWSSSCTTNPL